MQEILFKPPQAGAAATLSTPLGGRVLFDGDALDFTATPQHVDARFDSPWEFNRQHSSRQSDLNLPFRRTDIATKPRPLNNSFSMQVVYIFLFVFCFPLYILYDRYLSVCLTHSSLNVPHTYTHLLYLPLCLYLSLYISTSLSIYLALTGLLNHFLLILDSASQ